MLFRKERKAVVDATNTAKQGINVALVVAGLAVVLASVAVVVAVSRKA